jgi:small subunit ribosomal protein S1
VALGAVLRGRVTAVKDYGAFVDLGGVEGLLHVSELGFQRVGHPSEVLKVGQELEVQVLRLDKGEDPRHPQRIALSLKALKEDPWAEAAARFPEGARARGTVARLEAFGAFVELEPGVEGLLHIGELQHQRRIKHPRDVLKVGQALDVTVLTIEPERRRVSLALAEPSDDASDAHAPPAPREAPRGFGTLGDLLKKGPSRR